MKSILPNSRKHDISFHPSGKIDISAHIARSLSLAQGDVIDIAYKSANYISTSNCRPAIMPVGMTGESGLQLMGKVRSEHGQKQ